MALWIFGDSFSTGTGLISSLYTFSEEKETFFTLPQPKDTYFFGDLIGLHYNIPPSEQFNRAIGGLSTPEIFLCLLAHIEKFKKDDLLIVGTSFPQREPFIMGGVSKEEILNNWVAAFRGGKFECTSGYPTVPSSSTVSKVYKDHIKPTTYEEAWKQSCLFSEVVKYPSSSLYMDWYDLHFSILLDFLSKSIGIKYILWSINKEWDKYESIKDATDGKIDDLHWSWKGSHDFGLSLLNRLQDKTV